jgi:Antibiotic biosynthesis monooxygenase
MSVEAFFSCGGVILAGSALRVHRAFRGRWRRISEKGQIMTAFNAVRFKVKAGREQQFLDAHNEVAFAWPGLRHVNVIKTGEHTFCVIAEWTDMDAIVNARDRMIATLDSFRDTLEDLGGGLGVTDPVVKTLK